MKLRIKGNSLRLRVTKSEVLQLRVDGRLSETVNFGESGTSLVFMISVIKDASKITVNFEHGELTVAVPEDLAIKWAYSDQIGIKATYTAPTVLIEKDFACLEPRSDEDENDMFPHPGQMIKECTK